MRYELKPFPLYDELVSTGNLSSIPEDITMSSRVSQLSGDRLNEFYLIIIHHAILTKTFSDSKVIPYAGKIYSGGCGVVLQLKELPPDLRVILWKYLEN